MYDIVTPHEMEQVHDALGVDDASGEDVTVAIQTSGIDVSHPRLQRQTNSIYRVDFTGDGVGYENGHGTMVADLATRVAKGVNLLSCRTFSSGPEPNDESFQDSFEFLLDYSEYIDVVIMSWSFGGAEVPWINEYVNKLADAGVIPFAAAGNRPRDPGSPATAKKAISVGALNPEGKEPASFTSWDGERSNNPGFAGVPDVSAIGDGVVGARAEGTMMGLPFGDDYVISRGTSFSNPFVANLGVDLIRRYPDITTKQMLEILETSAENLDNGFRDGMGRISWEGAIKRAEEMFESQQKSSVLQTSKLGVIPSIAGSMLAIRQREDEVSKAGGVNDT